VAGQEASEVNVLVVCTANVCRSPVAAIMLRRQLERLGVPASVRSAGFLEAGHRCPPELVDEVARHGLAVGDHASAVLDLDLIEGADLVVGMERRHIRDIILRSPDAAARAFTLKELVRRGEQVAGTGTGVRLETWLAELAAGRGLADLVGQSRADDTADPFGGSRRAYRQMVTEIDDLTARLSVLLAAHGAGP
jgi:protein-tyrosine phosphatase